MIQWKVPPSEGGGEELRVEDGMGGDTETRQGRETLVQGNASRQEPQSPSHHYSLAWIQP